MKKIITTLAIFIILFTILGKDVFSADTWTFTESPIKTVHTYNTETECNIERNKFLAKPIRQDAGPCVLQKTAEIPKTTTTTNPKTTTGTTQTTTTTTNSPKATTTGTTQTTTTTTNSPKATTTETTQTTTTTTQDSATKYWSYYRSDKRDLSGEVFTKEGDCMTASSNNPFADKTQFDSTWQNCFLSDKSGKPIAQDEYSFRETGGALNVTPQQNVVTDLDKYRLLAPFAGFTEAPEQVGDYLNKIFILAIGLCVALAVLMMIIAGVQYMGEESIFGKVNAKGQIKNALLGLLIALSAYALLNTIDPRLLGKGGVSIKAVKSVIVNLPDAGDTTVDKKCINGNAKYSTNYGVSGGVSLALSKIKSGFELVRFEVNSSTNEMTLVLKRTSDGYIDKYSKIKISPGAKGYSEIGQGVSRDFRTPKGTWRILSKIETKENAAVCSGSGSNMGAGFWKLNPTTNGERGIGIHGNEEGTRTTTAGCIRITNSDLLALNPYVKAGLIVEIK